HGGDPAPLRRTQLRGNRRSARPIGLRREEPALPRSDGTARKPEELPCFVIVLPREKQRGRTSFEKPPPLNPTSLVGLTSALVRARLEIDRLGCGRGGFRFGPGRRRRRSRLGIIGGEVPVRGRD